MLLRSSNITSGTFRIEKIYMSILHTDNEINIK